MKTKPPKRAYLGRCGTESKKQMKTKEKSLRELLADIQKASELERYDPAEDLKTLQTQYKRLSKWEFSQLLNATVEKYTAGEWSAIHAALVAKARAGDVDAIRMYREMQTSGGSSEVMIVDDL